LLVITGLKNQVESQRPPFVLLIAPDIVEWWKISRGPPLVSIVTANLENKPELDDDTTAIEC
jgi:hypothetical protein